MNVTSVTIPTTYATRVSSSVEDGVTVIVSQLFITASERFPVSSVKCQINGQGPIKSISFNTTGTPTYITCYCTLNHTKSGLRVASFPGFHFSFLIFLHANITHGTFTHEEKEGGSLGTRLG